MEQLITIKNGNKQNSVFSSEEMEKRLSKLRSNMESENIDAILFTSIHNINYYNHFVYCSFGRPYGLVVTKDKLKSILGEKLFLNFNVDKKILGGLIVKIGSKMIDSSLLTKINKLKIAMREA